MYNYRNLKQFLNLTFYGIITDIKQTIKLSTYSILALNYNEITERKAKYKTW